MKLLFCVLTLVSASAFGTTCFTANIQTPPSIPAKICFDSIQIRKSNLGSQIVVHGPDIQGTFAATEMPVSAHPIVLEYKSVISLSNTADTSCGSSEKVDLIVKFSETAGQSAYLPEDLFIAVQQQKTYDTCHSEMQLDTFYYTATK